MEKSYKGYAYILDKDGLWKVKLDKYTFIIVALDDTKLQGNKRIINEQNNEDACKRYIDTLE